ncbi:hypothetical protein [Streptomyces decoyicus]
MLPLVCGDEPFHHVPELGGSDSSRIVGGPEPDRIQDRGPGRGTHLQNSDE